MIEVSKHLTDAAVCMGEVKLFAKVFSFVFAKRSYLYLPEIHQLTMILNIRQLSLISEVSDFDIL